MQALLTLLLRCVLLLALWPGMQAWAHADAGASPCARHDQPAMPEVAAAGAGHGMARANAESPAMAAAALAHAQAGGQRAAPAAGPGSACPGHAASGTHPDCCQGGACGCRCGAPAVAATVYLATPVPAAHDPVVALFDYQPSHLLPQPYRPPIA